LKVPLFNCLRQKAHTKCSGWNLRNMAVIQRPATNDDCHLSYLWLWWSENSHSCSLTNQAIMKQY